MALDRRSQFGGVVVGDWARRRVEGELGVAGFLVIIYF
jgi:hypothetical protein